MVVNSELLRAGIVQFSNKQSRESKMLPGRYWPEQTVQNKRRAVDACELFAHDDKPKSKRLHKRAKKSS